MGLRVNDDRLATRVGGGVIAIVIVAAALVVGAEGLHLRAQIHFQVFFEQPGALTAGADVQAAGTVIGEVENIRLVPASHATSEDHPLHPNGGIVADVRIEKRYAYMAPHRADYFVSAKGIFGERYLEIGAPMGRETQTELSPDGLGRSVREGDSIRGIDPPSMDRVLLRSYSNLVTSRLFLSAVEPHWRRLVRELDALSHTLEEIEPSPGAYERLGDSISVLSDRVDTARATWKASGLEIDDFRSLSANARSTFDRVDRNLADLEQRLDVVSANIDRLRGAVPEDLAAQFRVATDKTRNSVEKLRRIASTARELAAIIDRGEGNLGGLLHDPEFADNAKEIGKIIKRKPWTVVGHPQDD